MSDDDEERKKTTNENLERWRVRLETGDPVMTFYIDEPLDIGATQEGGLLLKFVFGQLGGFQQAAMAMAVLTPAVARRLKFFLGMLENIPDTLPPTPGAQSKN
jgi:hypothetical protein